MISGTLISVSTLLTAVGMRKRPDCVGKGRLVARFAAIAFDRIEQRGFFAADISAGASADFDIEVQARGREYFRRESRFASAESMACRMRSAASGYSPRK